MAINWGDDDAMRLKPQLRIEQITMRQLLECHQPDRVLGFCQACNNFGRNHSCPQFDFDVLTWLNQFAHVTLVLTQIETAQLADQRRRLAAKDYLSRVRQSYQKDGQIDLYTELSMYAFESVKGQVNRRFLEIERQFDGVVSIPPGSCTHCAVCAKRQGKACLYPEKLRYSLEALGFLVSQLLDVFFDYQIDWQKRDFGTDFVTISGLFSHLPLAAQTIRAQLADIELEL